MCHAMRHTAHTLGDVAEAESQRRLGGGGEGETQSSAERAELEALIAQFGAPN